jgi:hypothetical protein
MEDSDTTPEKKGPDPKRSVPETSASQTVAQIAASIKPEAKFTAPVRNPASFTEIYEAAEIRPAAHGYTILKVAEMLESELIRALPSDVKRRSVLVALEAVSVKITDIIEDAVRRDRALDTYERVQQKALTELENRKTQENRKIQEEIDRLVAEKQGQIQSNNGEIARERDRFKSWCLQKQKEEKRISAAISHFVSENPITVSGGNEVDPAPKAQGS